MNNESLLFHLRKCFERGAPAQTLDDIGEAFGIEEDSPEDGDLKRALEALVSLGKISRAADGGYTATGSRTVWDT